VDNHDNGHDQGQNVHEVVGGLEDERVGDLNCPRVAVCLYACTAIDLLLAHQSAQRYRGLCTYRREVAEAHVCALLCLRFGGVRVSLGEVAVRKRPTTKQGKTARVPVERMYRASVYGKERLGSE
jgi:hypothetical protein